MQGKYHYFPRLRLVIMPPPTQQALIYILLLWTTVLSISQVTWIILYFSAAGHNSTKQLNEASHDLMPFKSNHSFWQPGTASTASCLCLCHVKEPNPLPAQLSRHRLLRGNDSATLSLSVSSGSSASVG
ncbi:uncharacterized protein LOC144043813 isoform X2 [Vanacampus margaritifer]